MSMLKYQEPKFEYRNVLIDLIEVSHYHFNDERKKNIPWAENMVSFDSGRRTGKSTTVVKVAQAFAAREVDVCIVCRVGTIPPSILDTFNHHESRIKAVGNIDYRTETCRGINHFGHVLGFRRRVISEPLIIFDSIESSRVNEVVANLHGFGSQIGLKPYGILSVGEITWK